MAIDFTGPVKTANYDTGILGVIRNNQIAIASFLDGVAITAGNTAGLKRYNASSSLFEKSDGTAWTEMSLAYLKLAGGTLTGALVLAADPAVTLGAATKGYVDTGLAGKASSSALAAYAPIAGANFSGAVTAASFATSTGSISSATAIGAATNISAGAAVFAGQSGLTVSGQFYIGAASATLPIVNFDSGDYFGFDRSANQYSLTISGVTQLTADATKLSVPNAYIETTAFDTRLMMRGGAGSPTKSGSLNFSTGAGADAAGFITFQRRAATGDTFEAVMMSLGLTTGNMTVAGLVYGRNGGAGLGQITLQNGGSPSGGAAGDLLLIY